MYLDDASNEIGGHVQSLRWMCEDQFPANLNLNFDFEPSPDAPTNSSDKREA